MKQLVDLPKDIWRAKIIPFVNVYDLVRVESAANNHGFRDVLLRNISDANLTNFIIDENNYNTIPWLVSHNILPLRVTLEKPVHQTCEEWIDVFFSQAIELHFKFRGKLTNLRDIIGASFKTVSSICIKGSVMHSLGSVAICSELSSLQLIGCEEIEEHELLESLRNCNIHELIVCDPSQLSEKFFKQIFTLLPNLQSLDVKLVRNWDTILVNLVRQTNLTRFVCEGGIIGKTAVHTIAHCMPLLEGLILRASLDEPVRVAESDIELLVRNCPHITELALMQIPSMGDAVATSIALYLPSLQRLTLALCVMSDTGLSEIARSCTQLRSVSLPLAFHITDAGIQALGQHCVNLEHLGVPADFKLTDRAFDTLTLAALRSVDVTYTRLTGAVLQTLLREGSALTKLIWNRCSSNSIISFVDSLPLSNGLQDLSLENAGLTQPEWMELSRRLSRLRRLNLSGCRAVDGEVVRSFIDHNPQLLSFTLRRCSDVPRELFQEFACLRDISDSEETGIF